jgi:hypothetical protein
MSATRTFSPLTANTDLTTIDPYVNGSKFGYQDAERARQDLDILSYLCGHFDLGGDERPILSASYVGVNGHRSYDLNGDTLGGMTLEAVVYFYTTNASTTVNVRVRNTTDGSNAGAIAAASAATTVTREVVTLTLASGIKTYRLEVTGSDALNGIYAWGYLRIRKVPA